MIRSILNKIFLKTILFLRPLIRVIADQADIAMHTPRMPNGQNPLVFKDDINLLKNNIPKSVYFNTRSGKITIGSNTVFGEYVMVLTGKHQFISDVSNIADLHKVPDEGRDIEIGNNCYIGSGAIIIGPLKIGDFAVIGAGSVVTKEVEAYTLVAGVPAKEVKKLKPNYENK